jgi:hypothetical protein
MVSWFSGNGEQFAADCVIHHSVRRFSDISENRSKSVRVRALLDLFHDEGIEVLLGAQVSRVEGLSGKEVRVYAKDGVERIIEGTDLLVSVGRTPNTKGIGLEQVGVELDERGLVMSIGVYPDGFTSRTARHAPRSNVPPKLRASKPKSPSEGRCASIARSARPAPTSS